MKAQHLDALFSPASIAIVGASDRASSWTREIQSNLERFGFPGNVFPVNPRRPTVWGRAAYASVKDIPGEVDLAIIAIPAAAAVSAVEECGEARVPAAMVVSSGFRDAGAEGAEVQDQLASVAQELDLVLLGPNVEGFINYHDRVAAYGAEMPPSTSAGSISMFSQSGTAAWTFAHMAGDRGVGLRLVTGVGVEATLGMGDLLAWAATDPATSVAACYMETTRGLAGLERGLQAMAEAGKPVVVCCPRVASEAARRSAIAHTGELLGDTTLRDAFLRRCGAAVVHDPVALFETALLIESAPGGVSGGVGVAMQSGGNCTLFADALGDADVPLAEFSPKTIERLGQFLPSFTEPRNPLDVTGQAVFDVEVYCDAIDSLASDPEIGVVVIDVAPSRRDPDGSALSAILRHAGTVQRSSGKPVVSVLAAPLAYPPGTAAFTAQQGVAVLQGHAASAVGIRCLLDISETSRPSAGREAVPPDVAIPSGVLDETEAAGVFRAYGIERPREAVAATPEHAVKVAQDLGDLVVVKLISSQVPHKAREGLVKLGLRSPVEIEAAAGEIQDRAQELGVDGNLLVQQQVPAGPEFLIGVTVDPSYGPAMTVRPGGGDVSGASRFELLPLRQGEAENMAAEATAEASVRLSHVEMKALVQVVDRFSWLGLDLADRLQEIEANPVIITDGRAVAVDALAVATDRSGDE